jgi:hypothetical protein
MVELGARDAEDEQGESTLCLAIRKGYAECAVALVERSHVQGMQLKALMEAVWCSRVDIVAVLLARGLGSFVSDKGNAETLFECVRRRRHAAVGECVHRVLDSFLALATLAACSCDATFMTLWSGMSDGDKQSALAAKSAD